MLEGSEKEKQAPETYRSERDQDMSIRIEYYGWIDNPEDYFGEDWQDMDNLEILEEVMESLFEFGDWEVTKEISDET